jgi:HAD superfamily hydrolase (TIGR01549 family)
LGAGNLQSFSGPYWHPANQRGFILDWDGVLAETKLDFTPIYDRFFGGKRVMILEEAARLPATERAALYEAIEKIEVEGAEKAKPVLGALELISWLEKNDIPWAVVSRNTKKCVAMAAKRASIKLPPIVITRDDGLLKPDPQVFLKASELLEIPWYQCVVIGDFLYDIVGARRACMRAVLVRRANEEWSNWADVAYNEVIDLFYALGDPQPLIPWEYQPVVRKRGFKWLERAFGLTVKLVGDDAFEILTKLAPMGVGSFCIDNEVRLEADRWRNSPYIDPKYLWEPLDKVVSDFLIKRFPLAKVVSDGEVLDLPGGMSESISFIEELLSR